MDKKTIEELKDCIRNIPDFPKKGILFRDITTLLANGKRFKQAVEMLAEKYRDKTVTKVAAIEARGFIFGGVIAYNLNAGFVPIRKKGKLPAEVYEVTYDLEYGSDTLQIHRDALTPEDKVLLVDDLLATGGTALATARLIEKSQAKIVGIEFLIELSDLQGLTKLKDYPVHSIIRF
ncbi:MAG: adenine phosphoribosyltransferase [Candidatus Omnitrophica bacterium]|nr:adenine phosphoribosyltransferase [Candidatus Omnitrophota bacterium]